MSAPERLSNVRARGLSSWLAVIVGVEVAFAASTWLAPRAPVTPVVGFVVSYVLVVGAVLGVAVTAPVLHRRAWALGVVGAGLLLLVAGTRSPDAAPYLVLGGLLVLGTGVGAGVGNRIQHGGHVLIVAIVTALADAYSVLSATGPTATAARSEVTLSFIALPWPLFGTDAIPPVLGVGDVIVTTLYAAAARRFGVSLRRLAVALALAYAAILVALLVFERALPALPALGLAVVLSDRRFRQLRREDLRPALIGAVLLGMLFFALYLLL